MNGRKRSGAYLADSEHKPVGHLDLPVDSATGEAASAALFDHEQVEAGPALADGA